MVHHQAQAVHIKEDPPQLRQAAVIREVPSAAVVHQAPILHRVHQAVPIQLHQEVQAAAHRAHTLHLLAAAEEAAAVHHQAAAEEEAVADAN
jgi:hypothetical protein